MVVVLFSGRTLGSYKTGLHSSVLPLALACFVLMSSGCCASLIYSQKEDPYVLRQSCWICNTSKAALTYTGNGIIPQVLEENKKRIELKAIFLAAKYRFVFCIGGSVPISPMKQFPTCLITQSNLFLSCQPGLRVCSSFFKFMKKLLILVRMA